MNAPPAVERQRVERINSLFSGEQTEETAILDPAQLAASPSPETPIATATYNPLQPNPVMLRYAPIRAVDRRAKQLVNASDEDEWDDTMRTKIRNKLALSTLFPVATLLLAGCWTPPNANVQPRGEPRQIQAGIIVQSVKDPVDVQAIDAAARTITFKLAGDTTATYTIGESVKDLGKVQAGSQVKATVTEMLDVYLLANGLLPGGGTAESLGVNARVLLVDPSYRLLTLQYPDGRSETFKPGLDVKLQEMAPGDDVVVRPREVTAIRLVKK
jgi:hypothetical protein